MKEWKEDPVVTSGMDWGNVMSARGKSKAHGVAGQLSGMSIDGVKHPQPHLMSDNMKKDAHGMFQDLCIGSSVLAFLYHHLNEVSSVCM